METKHKSKMKKFTLKGVLDGIRSSVSAPPKYENEVEETLRTDHFQVCKVGEITLEMLNSKNVSVVMTYYQA